MTTVKVSDSGDVIATINLILDTPDAVVLTVDLKRKHVEVEREGFATVWLDDARIDVLGIPFDPAAVAVSIDRFHATIAIARYEPGCEYPVLHRGKPVERRR